MTASQRVAPNASAASRRALGTSLIISSVVRITIGIISMPSAALPARAEKWPCFATIHVHAKTPTTIDGVPFITSATKRTTEEMIKLVPNALREAALALGYPRWRTSLTIVLRTCLPGIVTGSLLAVARIAGETAPLLFTALGNQFVSTDMSQPMAALPLVVFSYATGPYEEWHALAWATALVLILVVLVLSLLARWATRSRFDTRG